MASRQEKDGYEDTATTDPEQDEKQTAGEKAQARIDRGNRRAEAAEAEDPAEREERIREGQVFEDLAPGQDDPRRRLKVLLVEGEGDDAPVLVENLVSRVHSRIRSDRLLSDAFQRSV
jgi:hypothetical protein